MDEKTARRACGALAVNRTSLRSARMLDARVDVLFRGLIVSIAGGAKTEVSSHRVALKVFGRRVTDDGVRNDPDEPPASLDWIPSSTSNNYDPAPEPGQMLDWDDDVIHMIEETTEERDATATALQFDAGRRGFEFSGLTVGDITDHDHGLQVTVDGKQGRRTVLLIPSVPYVRDWLDEHPAPDDRDAPLWSKLDTLEEISYRMLTKMFEKPAERADIEKPVTLTNFRKSSASYHASEGLIVIVVTVFEVDRTPACGRSGTD